jgi:soluble lytic murein transglycosylase-like protein
MREMAVSGRVPGGYNQKNKSMRICLKVMAVLAAAAGMLTAEPSARVSTTVRADLRTGRLVRSTVVAPKLVRPVVVGTSAAGAAPARARRTDYDGIVEEAARAHSVDPLLVHSVIRVESNYNPVAVSSKGAAGLMQLIPATARRFGASNRFDVKENITAGVKYLKYLQEMFKDDRLALAAYNAGEGAVQKYKDIPPYRETEDYVWKVGQHYGAARRAEVARPAAANPADAGPLEAAAGPKPEPLRGLEVATGADGRVILKTR